MLLEQCVQATGVGLLVLRSDNWLTLHGSVLDDHHGRKQGDVVLGCQAPVLIDIYFKDDRPAIVLTRDFIDPRCECLARASPGGEKIDQHGLIAVHRFIKIGGVRITHRCPGLVVIVRITGL